MTPEEITKLRELCNGATPGPWSVSEEPEDKRAVINDLFIIACRVDAPSWDADAAFISASREAVPKLLNALEAAEREREEARETAEQYAIENETSVHIRVIKERDTARARLAEVEQEMGEHGSAYVMASGLLATEQVRSADALKERDTARAQVKTLAEALRWYANDATRWEKCGDIPGPNFDRDRGDRARAALKAAGLDNTSGEST